MPDHMYEIGTITITVGIDEDGADVTSVDLAENLSILQALGAIQVAQRDLLNSIETIEE